MDDQHFLRNPEKINLLIREAHLNPEDTVLEIGAGIGSVARHLPNVERLILLDLDRELVRTLRFQFPDAEVIQGDVVQILPDLDFDVVFSNLPFFLSEKVIRVLSRKTFRCGFVSVKSDFDFGDFTSALNIQEIMTLNGEDFFPRQPFKSKVIRIEPRIPTAE